MADRAVSHHYGEANPVVTKPIGSADVVEVGDMVSQAANGDIKTASQETWVTNLAGTQEPFHDKFLGVAQERSRSGDTNPIRVNTSGVHEFDCAAATFEIGTLVGPADSGSSSLEDQKVVAVATENLATGRVAKRYGSNTTKVFVKIFSTKLDGGAQAMA